ncbi:PSD1 and planctomycete cytochrome C domain-containing protein [Rhodopirellula halodulae]|uniref:PSD1 and planctomycete cytochrome C domain-containing protein n=1 Tax=Rhodopirellula halodulae TaxID=2894198 RepID=UPI001E2CA7A5|nr:PSD1 and planctomycete cytochrome C domain-containing protein [Rhodopirellula sp. JC737]MCC9656399.1 PSD1 and planctomycete cytochrome C domain-containing protein [Rhodopirellula sp. JC737]
MIATAEDDQSQTLPETIRFNDHIRPIFNAQCTACHGGVKQAGDVSFVYRDKVLPPDGWVIEPGDPEASIIMERITSEDEYEVMPPPEHGPPLSDYEVALVRRWIEQGAKWGEHWAYEKPNAPEMPVVSDVDWCRQSIDRFVLAKLDEKGYAPSQDEIPSRWLRRATLDLTGLPPTPEDVNDFEQTIQDKGEIAYEEAVDRLLQRPEFGERWASVWLDQIRYADSKGLGLDGPRTTWKYRDYVIDAFNRDMPYDEFTIQQIAGDLKKNPSIEDYIATAAHRLTQSNEEGGTDDEEFRVEAILDRVNTTWQVWQGVTFGCVQCHSHPYDPFEHDEYYEFAAFFNNTADSDLNEDWPVLRVPVDPAHYDQAAELDAQIRPLERTIWEQEYATLANAELWNPIKTLSASTNKATQVAVEDKTDHAEFHTVGTVARNTDITLESEFPEGMDQLTAVRFTGMPLDPEKAVSDSEWGFVLSHVEAKLVLPGEEEPKIIEFADVISDEPTPFYDPRKSLDGKSNQGFSAYTRIHYPRSAAFVLKESMPIPDGAKLQFTIKHRVYLLAAFSLVTRRGHLAVSDSEAFQELLANADLKEQRDQLADLKSRRGKINTTTVPVLAEREAHLARPSHVFIRGLFLTKDKEVTPGTPASMPELETEGSADRMALARWLVSDENPLTARVAVNRVWSQIFGIGLVATEEDFGSSGEAPSHPQLLDHLAVRFQNTHQWKFKPLIREILLSRTYRQSSVVTEELKTEDPANRWLARGPRHRLDAETVRDQALAISGLLSDTMHGPPVHPPIPDGVWTPFAGWDKWNTPKTDDGNRYRRSIYTYTKRSIPFPMFAAFDAPSREFCTPRRLRSNTPIQALMTLNDQTFAECAAAFAERMRDESEAVSDQIRSGFERATCREPSAEELTELVQLHQQIEELKTGDPLAMVANVLLNLDEVLTK